METTPSLPCSSCPARALCLFLPPLWSRGVTIPCLVLSVSSPPSRELVLRGASINPDPIRLSRKTFLFATPWFPTRIINPACLLCVASAMALSSLGCVGVSGSLSSCRSCDTGVMGCCRWRVPRHGKTGDRSSVVSWQVERNWCGVDHSEVLASAAPRGDNIQRNRINVPARRHLKTVTSGTDLGLLGRVSSSPINDRRRG